MQLLNCSRFQPAHFSSFSRSLWIVAWPSDESAMPPGFVLSANLLRVLSRSKSLTKMLNRTESSTDPSGTPIIVTGLQLDFVPLDTTLWTNSLSRFSTHITICSSSPYLSSFSVSILLNSTMKVFLKSRQTISSLSPHLSSQSFNCRSLSCCLSISYSLQIHAGSQLPVCPWKQVPELFVPLPSQWSRWDWYIL